jgi:hypothetical protein
LDSFNDLEKFSEAKPSTLLKGAWHTMQKENRLKNPDWMAQSAHSFREIHYGLGDDRRLFFQIKRIFVLTAIRLFKYNGKNIPRNRRDKISDSLKAYVADRAKRQEISIAINKAHLAFTKIAHHFKEGGSLRDTLNIFTFLGIAQSSQTSVESEDYEKLVDIFDLSREN